MFIKGFDGRFSRRAFGKVVDAVIGNDSECSGIFSSSARTLCGTGCSSGSDCYDIRSVLAVVVAVELAVVDIVIVMILVVQC